MRMTKNQACIEFKSTYDELLKGEWKTDKPARRMAWNNYVDMLNKDGLVTDKQADTWGQPQFIKN